MTNCSDYIKNLDVYLSNQDLIYGWSALILNGIKAQGLVEYKEGFYSIYYDERDITDSPLGELILEQVIKL